MQLLVDSEVVVILESNGQVENLVEAEPPRHGESNRKDTIFLVLT